MISNSRLNDTVAVPLGAIEVHIRTLVQLFDSLDPSPFHERDLDRNAEEYIVSSAKELPRHAPISLVIHLDEPVPGSDDLRAVQRAIRVHFARRAELSRLELRRLLRRGWVSLIIGLSFLTAALTASEVLQQSFGESHIAVVVSESLLIGGWVAMWRPIEIFLYDWWPIVGERRIYDRLSQASVRLVQPRVNQQRASGDTQPLRLTIAHCEPEGVQ